MRIKELSELQSELETLKEDNKQAEANLLMEQGLSKEKVSFPVSLHVRENSRVLDANSFTLCAIISQVKKVGTLLMAVNNLAEQCYLAAYGPLEDMNALTKMDMVKVITQSELNISIHVVSVLFL